MRTKPVTCQYRGWTIESTPEWMTGGWCAIVFVHRSGGRKLAAVAFSGSFDDCSQAGLGGLMAGRRWIDADAIRPVRSHLVIVSRDRVDVFERLNIRFMNTSGISLIFDRRKAQHPVPFKRRAAPASRHLMLLTDGFMVVPRNE